jgi:hypothetical protein
MTKKISPDDEKRTTALGLINFAREYILAAEILEERADTISSDNLISPIPAYFCALHGIELTFKAYLRKKDVKLEELQKLGHSVEKCFCAAEKHNIIELWPHSEENLNTLKMLDELNENLALRYSRSGEKEYPLWGLIGPLTLDLYDKVASTIVGATTIDRAYPDTGDKE